VKERLGLDGPDIPALEWASLFAPALSESDEFESLTLRGLQSLVVAPTDRTVGWIIGSRVRRSEFLGNDRYLQALSATVDNMRRRGCEAITYFAYPSERQDGLRECGVDVVVEGSYSSPIELRIHGQTPWPGGGLAVMPRSSASVTLAHLFRGTPVPLLVVSLGNEKDGAGKLDASLWDLVREANESARQLVTPSDR
jgi:hypothetical protein